MTAPTIVSASSITTAASTSITITAPASISSGNLLIAVIAIGSISALTPPVGWSIIQILSAGYISYYKIATDVEPVSYTWTWSGSSVGCGLIVQITGNSVSPIDTYDATSNGSSVNISAPSLTPRPLTNLHVNVYVALNTNIITVPVGQNNIGGVTGNSRSIICGYETLSDVYATGTITSNNTNVSDGDTVTIGGKIYTFKTTLTPTEGEILIGASADDSLTNLSHAINNSGGTPGTDYQVSDKSAWVTCSAVSSHVLTFTSIGIGSVGNTTTFSKSASTLTTSGSTLSGGKNGNDATGTRIATTSSAVSNFGFSFSIKEPTTNMKLLPNSNIIGMYRTNYPNSGIIGIGAGIKIFTHNLTANHGFYKIEGYTRQITTGTTLARYAILLDMNGYPIYGQRTLITNSGFFSFQNLKSGNYIVMGIDENNVQNGVIASNVSAVPM